MVRSLFEADDVELSSVAVSCCSHTGESLFSCAAKLGGTS